VRWLFNVLGNRAEEDTWRERSSAGSFALARTAFMDLERLAFLFVRACAHDVSPPGG